MVPALLAAVRSVTLYLLVLLAGLLAGIHFYGLLAPVAQKLGGGAFVQYWQVVDGYMGQRMPVVGKSFLALFLLNLGLFFPYWRSVLFALLVLCFGLFVSDVVLTVRKQRPLNQYIQRLDARRLTPPQLKTVEIFRQQGEEHFRVRKILALVSFALLSVTPFLVPKSPHPPRAGPAAR